MIYTIHGKEVVHDGSECGIYQSLGSIQRMEYAVMDMGMLVRVIDDMPLEKSIDALTQLRDVASEQAGWEHTPQNMGFPILRQIPSEPSISIGEVRGNIRNTEKFCTDILTALRGK